MLTLAINQSSLSYKEAKALVSALKDFPDIIYVPLQRWLSIKAPYKVYIDEVFAGVCVVYAVSKDCVKIGPMVVLEKFQGNGIAKIFLKRILVDYKDRKLIFIASSSSKLQKILPRFGFAQQKSLLLLPWSIKVFLVKQMLTWMSIGLIWESVRKRGCMKRNQMLYYLRKN